MARWRARRPAELPSAPTPAHPGAQVVSGPQATTWPVLAIGDRRAYWQGRALEAMRHTAVPTPVILDAYLDAVLT